MLVSRKGLICIYDNRVFCQEGYCENCCIASQSEHDKRRRRDVKSFKAWCKEHQKEVESIERETQERIRERNTQLDISLAIIRGYEKLRSDEMLTGQSPDYVRGFYDAYCLQAEIFDAIDKA